MGIKIKYELCDQTYIHKIVKNAETGRKYMQITCPSCQQVFDKKDFYTHVSNYHWKHRDEVLAKLFGHKSFPVVCTECHGEVKFDEFSGNFPRKCRACMTKEKASSLGVRNASAEDSIEDIKNKLANLDADYQQKRTDFLKQLEAKEKEDRWMKLDLNSATPKFIPESAWFVRKLSYELRTHIVNGGSERQAALELLNRIDSYIDSEKWKSDEGDVTTETSNKEGSSD
jgi:uncharacterized C2H2 Zn-finger protein